MIFVSVRGEISNILDYEENKNIIKAIDLLGRERKKTKVFILKYIMMVMSIKNSKYDKVYKTIFVLVSI